MPKRSTFAVLATIAAALVLLPAIASAQSGSAMSYLQRRDEDLHALLARPTATDTARAVRDARATAIVDQLVDYEAFARESLGTQWSMRTTAEQQAFTAVLTEDIQRSCREHLDRRRDYQITYLSEETVSGAVIVHTRVQSRVDLREPSVDVDYLMRAVNGAWRVTDFVTDGESAVSNQGTRLRRILARDGWAGLVTRLREHVARPAG